MDQLAQCRERCRAVTSDDLARVQSLLAANPEPEPELPVAAPVKLVVPQVAPTAPPPVVEPKARAKLYDPRRRGYMRSTREEGIGDELKAMQAEATGSPFFDSSTAKPSGTDAVIERLRGLGAKRSKP